MKRFKEIFPEDGTESSADQRYFQREFSGRITETRKEQIKRFVRSSNWESKCSHEHDCCGCCYKQRAIFSYEYGRVQILIVRYYNS